MRWIVYRAVRTESLYIMQMNLSLERVVILSIERFQRSSVSIKVCGSGTVFAKPYVANRSGSGRTRLDIHKLRHSGRFRLNAASFLDKTNGLTRQVQ